MLEPGLGKAAEAAEAVAQNARAGSNIGLCVSLIASPGDLPDHELQNDIDGYLGGEKPGKAGPGAANKIPFVIGHRGKWV